MNIEKIIYKSIGFSAKPLKTYHDREWCYGFNFQTDAIVKIGFVIYFHKTVFGIWYLR